MRGAAGVGSGLVSRVRSALAEPEDAASPWLRRGLRRDARALAERLERLRQAFSSRPDLLDRVDLSSSVTRLLQEEAGERVPVFLGGLAP